MIYISEAHASDEWKLGNIVDINQHKTPQDRINAATNFIEEYDWKIPTVVDSFHSMDNRGFEATYSAWPERYFIFKEGRMDHCARASNEYGFDRLGLKRSLRQLIPESRQSLLRSTFNIYDENAEETDCVHSDHNYEFDGDEKLFVPHQASLKQI